MRKKNSPRQNVRMIGMVIVLAFGMGAFFTFGKRLLERGPERKILDPFLARQKESSPAGVRSASPVHQPEEKAALRGDDSGSKGDPGAEEIWAEFKRKYGIHLKARFSSDGAQLVEIQGQVGQGRSAQGNFDPSDPQQAIKRAREILADLDGLLGAEGNEDLSVPVAKGDSLSAQVFFSQEVNGIPVVPAGKITVQLGPQGELTGMYSDYVQDLNVTNAFRLPSSDAALIAGKTAGREGHGSARVEGGARIVWVSRVKGKSGSGVEGRYAYDFTVHGYQTIVDADSGRVLYRRDQRQF